MATDPEAAQALSSVGIERFVLIEDSAYDSVRVLVGEIPIPQTP
jgi:hypothetical protein